MFSIKLALTLAAAMAAAASAIIGMFFPKGTPKQFTFDQEGPDPYYAEAARYARLAAQLAAFSAALTLASLYFEA